MNNLKIMNSLKTMTNNIVDYYKETFTNYGSNLKQVKWKNFCYQVALNLLICLSYAVFCALKEGSGNLYMSVFIPIFLVNNLILLYASLNNSSYKFSTLIIFLLTTGTALKIFMMPSFEPSSVSEAQKNIITILFGILASISVTPLIKYCSMENNVGKKSVYLFLILTIVLYFFALIFGKEKYGTKAWVEIGPLEFQLTEVTKLLAIVISVFIIKCEQISENDKSILALVLLCIHTFFLFLLNELGTLCVIILTVFSFRVIFVEQKKYVIRETTYFFVLIIVSITLCYGVYRISTGNITLQETNNVQVELPNDSDETEENGLASLDSSESLINEIIDRIALIYPKIENRVIAFIDPENAPEKYVGQIERAEDALMFTTFFGTPSGLLSSVPEIASDFVFIYLLVRLGLVGASLVLVVLILMLAEVAVEYGNPSVDRGEYMMAFIFVSSIVIQALICSCSNIGLFPVVGLTFPFLGHGSTTLYVNLFMTIFIISFLQKNIVKEEVINGTTK